MRWLNFLNFFVFFFSSFSLVAAETSYTLTTEELRGNRVRIHFKLSDFTEREVNKQGKIYTEIFLKDANLTDEKSKPALPKITEDLAFPKDTQAVRFKILKNESVEKAMPAILPSRGSLSRQIELNSVPYIESAIYQSDSVYPKKLVELSSLSNLRDLRLANLVIHPFRYNFKDQTLEILKELVLEITYMGDRESLDWVRPSEKVDLGFYKLYQKHFKNFPAEQYLSTESEAESTIIDSGRMLIISHDRFRDELSEFIEWKKLRGIKTFELYFADSEIDWRGLKELIQSYYNDERISYVLLVGDADLIPFHPGRSGNAFNNEADPMYALVDGDDSYPDIFISRFAVNTSDELQTVIRKTIDYERHPERNGEWYSKGLAVASEEGASTGLKDFERLDILNKLLLNWNFDWIDNVYEPNDETQMVTDAVNEGRSFINYTGHGWETGWVTANFQNRDILALENTRAWPFIVSVACVNGRFAYRYNDSFAEAWLKAGTKDSPRGAVAVFASSTNQSWVPPTVGQKKITELLTSELETQLGALFFNGSIAVLEDNSGTALQTFETWHIFGDASVQVRTKAPTEIEVRRPYIVSTIEGWTMGINTDLRLASVSITQGPHLIASGVTNANGQIVLSIKADDFRIEDDLKLSVTGYNRIPYEENFRIR